jgi:hypothetical protein
MTRRLRQVELSMRIMGRRSGFNRPRSGGSSCLHREFGGVADGGRRGPVGGVGRPAWDSRAREC